MLLYIGCRTVVYFGSNILSLGWVQELLLLAVGRNVPSSLQLHALARRAHHRRRFLFLFWFVVPVSPVPMLHPRAAVVESMPGLRLLTVRRDWPALGRAPSMAALATSATPAFVSAEKLTGNLLAWASPPRLGRVVQPAFETECRMSATGTQQ